MDTVSLKIAGHLLAEVAIHPVGGEIGVGAIGAPERADVVGIADGHGAGALSPEVEVPRLEII